MMLLLLLLLLLLASLSSARYSVPLGCMLQGYKEMLMNQLKRAGRA